MSVGAGLMALAILFTYERQSAYFQMFRKKEIKVYTLAALALFLSCALSLALASIYPLSFGGHTEEVHITRDLFKLWYLAWPLVLLLALSRLSDSQKQNALRFWIGALGVASLIGIQQHWSGWPKPQAIPGNDNHYHATVFFGHHLSVASILIFPFFSGLDFLKRRLVFSKGLLVGVLFLALVCLYFTISRTLWVALPIGIAAWALLNLPKREALMSLATIGLLTMAGSQLSSVQRRFLVNEGNSDRFRLWEANFDFFKLRPWTGVGFRHTEELSAYHIMEKFKLSDAFGGHAHNNFLEILAGTGLLGTASFVFFCGVIFWILFRARSKTDVKYNFSSGLISAWIVFHLNGLTQVNFWEGKVMHQMMIAIAWSLTW